MIYNWICIFSVINLKPKCVHDMIGRSGSLRPLFLCYSGHWYITQPGLVSHQSSQSTQHTPANHSNYHQPGTKLLFYKNIVWAISSSSIILLKNYRFLHSFLVKSYNETLRIKSLWPKQWTHVDQIRVNIVNVIFKRLREDMQPFTNFLNWC